MNDLEIVFFRHWNDIGIGLLAQISIILLIGLTAGKLGARRGPVWQSFVYRAALATLAVALVATLLISGRITGRLGVIQTQIAAVDNLQQLPLALEPTRLSHDTTAIAPTGSVSPEPTVPTHFRLPEGWPLAAPLTVWVLGIAFGLFWMLVCKCALSWMHCRASRIENAHANTLLAELADALDVDTPDVLVHPGVRSPFLSGIRRPAIYLPIDYEDQFDTPTLRAILAHEMAHLARRDCAWLLAARFAAAVLWFHPLVWLLQRRMVDAFEEACDDAVIQLNCAPAAYASSLLSLAEQMMPSRMERAYGIGVMPIRSSLGRRIQNILDSSKRYANISTAGRAAIMVFAVVAVSLIVVTFCPAIEGDVQWRVPAGYADQFTFAAHQGWSMAPVRSVTKFNGNPNGVPVIPAEDLPIVKAWSNLEVLTTIGGEGPLDSSRAAVEKVLKSRPHYFYAEHVLGLWYFKHNQMDKYRFWRDRSLADAPAILAGRVQYVDGKPVAGFSFSLGLTCHAGSGSNDAGDETSITWGDVTTDENGCYYLPVYRGVYQTQGMSLLTMSKGSDGMGGYNTVYTELTQTMSLQNLYLPGAFVSSERVGLLPPMIARPYLKFTGLANDKSNSLKNPFIASSNEIAVSWTPYPNATGYRASVNEHILSSGGADESGSSSSNEDPNWSKISLTNVHLMLHNSKPIFNRKHVYELRITALKGEESLSQSRAFYFVAQQGIAPLPVTREGIGAAMPGGTIQTMSEENGKLVVRGQAPLIKNWDVADLKWLQIFDRRLSKAEEGAPTAGNPPTIPFTLEFEKESAR